MTNTLSIVGKHVAIVRVISSKTIICKHLDDPTGPACITTIDKLGNIISITHALGAWNKEQTTEPSL